MLKTRLKGKKNFVKHLKQENGCERQHNWYMEHISSVNVHSGLGYHLHGNWTIQEQSFSHSDWNSHHLGHYEVYLDVKVKHIYLWLLMTSILEAIFFIATISVSK